MKIRSSSASTCFGIASTILVCLLSACMPAVLPPSNMMSLHAGMGPATVAVRVERSPNATTTVHFEGQTYLTQVYTSYKNRLNDRTTAPKQWILVYKRQWGEDRLQAWGHVHSGLFITQGGNPPEPQLWRNINVSLLPYFQQFSETP